MPTCVKHREDICQLLVTYLLYVLLAAPKSGLPQVRYTLWECGCYYRVLANNSARNKHLVLRKRYGKMNSDALDSS